MPQDLPRRDGGEDQPVPPSFIDILERLLRAHDDSSGSIPDQGLFLEYRTDAWVVSGTCFVSLHRENAEGY